MIGKLCTAALLMCATVFAQTPSPTPHAFEVVSIRPSKPGSNWKISWMTTPDGYRVPGQSLRSAILMAYFPQGMPYWRDRVQGAPSWIGDLYDIDARVSETDQPQWQKESTLKPAERTLFPEMLQAMLADRCKLVVHRVPSEIPGFALVLGKRGPHLVDSAPGATLPNGMKLGSGGVAVPSPRDVRLTWTFDSATTADLVGFLSLVSSGHPVVDRTRLTGHYDFVLGCAEFDPDHPNGGCGSHITDQPNPLDHWDLDSLGLHLEPIKIPIDNLVIDHIEKPSEN